MLRFIPCLVEDKNKIMEKGEGKGRQKFNILLFGLSEKGETKI